ncbi:MAG: formylglycine-generating enzyme family protein, partial [Cyanobacteria bacterium P01_G01_bin.49]
KRRYRTVEEVLQDFPQIQLENSNLSSNIVITNSFQNNQTISTKIQSANLSNAIQVKPFSFETITIMIEEEERFWRTHYHIVPQKKQCQVEQFILNLATDITLDMVSISGGKFLMGSPRDEEESRDNERPQHWVTVPSFYIGKYPITQAQWQTIMGNNPSHFKGSNKPVENVSWDDCVKFCYKLSQQTGLNFSLPSEAKWEYACRARTTTPFYFGETITSELANYNSNHIYNQEEKGIHREQTTDVGSFPPNTFGLYDMHGNVWEWCADEWHESYIGSPTDGSVWSNGNSRRSPLRGGSWYDMPHLCRSAIRVINLRQNIYNYVSGFRVVCV